MSDFESYYITQAGSGLSGFRGVRYQRGYGFFGRLLSGAVYPMLRFLGKNLLKTGANVANDLLESGDFSKDNFKNVAMRNVKSRSKEAFDEAVDSIKKKIRGEGRRKRVKRTSRKLLGRRKVVRNKNNSIKVRSVIKKKKASAKKKLKHSKSELLF
ncbi:MAG: hypothetical protein QM535_17405 [Limnohabitans sp.]|nr:hypothetical protein [Limnohabitans sp.]